MLTTKPGSIACNRDKMIDWYKQITKPLKRLGWLEGISEELDVVDGMRRCATNPEVMKRPQRPVVPPKSHHHSACPVLEGAFLPPVDETYEGKVHVTNLITRAFVHDFKSYFQKT